MRSPVFVRNHMAVLTELAARGHAVDVAFEGLKEGAGTEQTAPIERLAAGEGRIGVAAAPVPHGPRALIRRRARSGIDYLRYLGPAYRDADALRDRAAGYAPPGLARLAGPLRRRPVARERAAGVLRRVVAACGEPAEIAGELRRRRPDALIVTPLMHFGSPQPDYVRVARRLGVPSALVTFSWDNFTNKTLMHEIPDLVTVWNEIQAGEAAAHHGVPRERLAVTGAPAYDHWFAWAGPSDRAAFLARAGLPADRPYLLYVCSSNFIAPDEPVWVAEWLRRVRAAAPPVRDAGVLVRPHPLNAAAWRDVSLDGAVLFPRHGADPADGAARTDYYDSIHHAAGIVGLNTSALVESAILGRASYTVLADRYARTQSGTLHFHHLRSERGGPLHVAATFDEHIAQLEQALARTAPDPALERFVRAFVRPHGLDQPAAPLVVDALERMAA